MSVFFIFVDAHLLLFFLFELFISINGVSMPSFNYNLRMLGLIDYNYLASIVVLCLD